MKKALVVGGSNGIGLSIVVNLLDKCDRIYIVDIKKPNHNDISKNVFEAFKKKVVFIELNLSFGDFTIFNNFIDEIDILFITAGIGRTAKFDNLCSGEIDKTFDVNLLAPIKIIKCFFNRLKSNRDFYCAIMCSIAGYIASPLLSIYGSSKSGLCSFIKSINSELAAQKYKNRILDVSPGFIDGTSFYGKQNNIALLDSLANSIISNTLSRETLFIPSYDEVYKSVLDRERKDYVAFGIDSYNYKINNGRISLVPNIVVGYLSGTFDLFHIGHLNIIKKAKSQCDYLIVGVHESGAWKGKETFIPFEERLEIVKSCKFVDEAHKSFKEDCDAWEFYHFNKLFVGSDYKGTERFKRYEDYFKNKDVEIIYFPYTKGTSSTQLRDKISKDK